MTTAIHDSQSETTAGGRPSRIRDAGRIRIRLGYAAGGWALLYAAYRGYYALGGTIGMFGTPVSESQWRQINAVGAVLLAMAAIVAFVTTTRLWNRRYVHMALLTFAWVAFTGCVMHGLVDIATRLLSMAGVIHMEFPFWASMDRRASNLQDIFLNEPWFLIEGLLWGALGWIDLTTERARRWWLFSALTAIALLTVDGLLTSTGVLGKVIIG
ncbi:MAG TPA: hypothetical protein VF201_16450 [Nitrolancea sp.]